MVLLELLYMVSDGIADLADFRLEFWEEKWWHTLAHTNLTGLRQNWERHT